MKKLFLQLYQAIDDWNYSSGKVAYCHNGFHYVWDEAQPVWMEVKHGAFDQVPEADEVYMTATGFIMLDKMYKWAVKAPEQKFIVGGPLVLAHEICTETSLPPNLIIHRGMAEQLFDKVPNPKNFKLVLPPTDLKSCYAYPYKTYCKWGKCIYCTEHKHLNRTWDLETLYNAPPGIVYLTTVSADVDDILKYKELNFTDKEYNIGIRADLSYLPALEEVSKVIPLEKMLMKVGVEFPSERMLRYMNKGLTVDDYTTFITRVAQMGYRVGLSFISHWGILEEQDLTEAANFFDKILPTWQPDRAAACTPLIIYGALGDTLKKLWNTEPVKVGAFIVGHYIKLDERQKQLNDKWLNLLIKIGISRDGSTNKGIQK